MDACSKGLNGDGLERYCRQVVISVIVRPQAGTVSEAVMPEGQNFGRKGMSVRVPGWLEGEEGLGERGCMAAEFRDSITKSGLRGILDNYQIKIVSLVFFMSKEYDRD